MPRRSKIPRKVKYSPPLTRTTDRFVVKLMKDGKKGLAEKILRQALARAEAQAGRPGLEVLDAEVRVVLNNFRTPLIGIGLANLQQLFTDNFYQRIGILQNLN